MGASVLIASVLNSWLSALWRLVPYEIPALTLSIPLTFAALFLIYDKWLWKWPGLSRIAGVPDISGEWEGPLNSSHQDTEEEEENGQKGSLRPEFTIHQTWSRIEINGAFRRSRSESTTASFRTEKGNPQLVFTYQNHPRTTEENDGPHEGVNKLRLATDVDGSEVLEGEYYTDESRNNHGTITLRRPGDGRS